MFVAIRTSVVVFYLFYRYFFNYIMIVCYLQNELRFWHFIYTLHAHEPART